MTSSGAMARAISRARSKASRAKSKDRRVDGKSLPVTAADPPSGGTQAPNVTIPISKYLPIIGRIINVADKETLLLLRTTCKSLCSLVDLEFGFQISITTGLAGIQIESVQLGRIPMFYLNRSIDIGATYVSDSFSHLGPYERQALVVEDLRKGRPPSSAWLFVEPSSARRITCFMSQVRGVRIVGPIKPTPSAPTLSREEQVARDPHRRVSLGPFVVTTIQSAPKDGKYATFVPFTNVEFVAYWAPLAGPIGPENVWMHDAPLVVYGATHLCLDVSFGCELLEPLISNGPLEYPETLKYVHVKLSVRCNGHGHLTVAYVRALSGLWRKIFGGFRPGIIIYVKGLEHQIDTWPDNLRFYLATIFCVEWLGPQAFSLSPGQIYHTANPHLVVWPPLPIAPTLPAQLPN